MMKQKLKKRNPSRLINICNAAGKVMPDYEIRITKTAQKQLDRLSALIAEKVIKAILSLASDSRPQGYKKLRGRNGYRIRKGDFRIIYDIYDKILVVEIIAIGHRKDIYE